MGLLDRLKLFRGKKRSPEEELAELLEGYELPSFPGVVMSVLTTLRDPEASMKEVAEQLLGDPGMNVKVLRTVNSAAFGLANKVTNIHRAVTLLGRARLETIVLTHGVRDSLPQPQVPGWDARRFWLSAAERACLARALAAHLHPATKMEAFTASLLQDMAVPVLLGRHGEAYIALLQRWNAEPGLRLDELEQAALGTDHAKVGALMAARWQLPEHLIQSVALHHAWQEQEEVDPAVGLASLVRDCDDEAEREALAASLQPHCGLDEQTLIALISSAFEEAAEFAAHLE
jgi:HD-like signal output (HDOD) protein